MTLKNFIVFAVGAFLLAAPAGAAASDFESALEGWSFGVGAGALGGGNISVGYRMPYNPDTSYNWLNKFVFRADFNTWAPFGGTLENVFDNIASDEIDNNRRWDGLIEFTDGITATNADFKSSVDGRNFGVLVDFHPFTYTRGLKGFRVSGGYYFGNLNIGANARVTGLKSDIDDGDFTWEAVNIGGRDYMPMITGLDAGAQVEISNIQAEPKLTLHSKGPYAGFGWDVGLYKKLKLTLDAGLAFTKTHEFSMTDNLDSLRFQISSETITINIDNDVSIPDDIKPEVSQSIQNKLTASNVPFTTANNNIIVGTAQLLANNQSAIDSALDSVRADRDKAINDMNKELNNYGFFPMIRIGFMWRF